MSFGKCEGEVTGDGDDMVESEVTGGGEVMAEGGVTVEDEVMVKLRMRQWLSLLISCKSPT